VDRVKAEIIAVGSELLTPSFRDTNSTFITERLNEFGIEVQAKAIAGDDRQTLESVVADSLRRCDVLILTGGLGPTDDDVTREVVAEVVRQPLEFHADIFEAIEKRFAARGLQAPAINRRQAMVPRGAVVLPNANGTAPGLWIEHDRKLVVLLPGPPRELKPMLEAVIRDRLLRVAGSRRLLKRVLRVTGGSESFVEERMQPLYARWRDGSPEVATTILASLGQIELHLSTNVLANDTAAGLAALDGAVADMQRTLGADVFSVDGETMPELLGSLLRERGLRIAAAESCTGGLMMTRLTDVPHSSDYVDRGVVVYSNQSKTDLLGVPPEMIAAHGAVSEPVAEAMALGMARVAGTEVAVGITGIAGPSGGTAEKPVGLVVIAAAVMRAAGPETRVRTFNFIGGREMIRFQASQAAMDMVRRWLLEEPH
jgi:nicotinamide-nucleotide amidase